MQILFLLTLDINERIIYDKQLSNNFRCMKRWSLISNIYTICDLCIYLYNTKISTLERTDNQKSIPLVKDVFYIVPLFHTVQPWKRIQELRYRMYDTICMYDMILSGVTCNWTIWWTICLNNTSV